ncbi:MAG: hypothetical protein ACP6IQ_04850 [Candidatus Njordarchaeia archaeon]|nr:hypothetical protein [Candidatus Korarchaeota archaeon]
MGISEIERKLRLQSAKKRKKYELMLKDLKVVISKLSEAVRAIEEFQKKWGNSSKSNLAISLDRLLNQIGLDQSPTIKPGLMDRIMGKFHLKLALEILRLLEAEKENIFPLSTIVGTLNKKFPNITFKPEDVLRSLKILKEKGLIFDLLKVGSLYYVVTEPLEEEINKVLSLSADRDFISIPDLVSIFGWDYIKAERVLDRMYQLGLVVREDFPRKYWFIKE